MVGSSLLFRCAAAAVLAAGLSACDWMEKKDPPGLKTEAEQLAEKQARLRRACASDATYDRLKELAFDEATRIRGGDPRALDNLATYSVVRMEQPLVKSRDDTLNVTVCQGRFILELPPGAENAFDGQRRLAAEIEYAAQEAADGSGMVYQMDGAEPIVYRLATAGTGRTRMAEAQLPPAPPPVAATPALPRPSAAAEAQRDVPAEPQQRQSSPAPETPTWTQVAERKIERTDPGRTAASPSFNCARGRSRSERMVCGSGELAALDRRMSSQFYSALADADADTRRSLRNSRDRFLARRERCADEACVASAYQERMAEIADITAR